MKISAAGSIKNKLFLLFIGVLFTTALVVSLFSYMFVSRIYQQSYKQDLRIQAAVLGGNCQVALTFNLPDDGRDMLAKLVNHPSVVTGKIFDAKGQLFAQYIKAEGGGMPKADLMTIRQPITFNGRVIGNIELQDNMLYIKQFRAHLYRSLSVIVLILLIAGSVIILKLSSIISRPLLDLANLADQVASDQDYSRRVHVSGYDEIGKLGRSVNIMLEAIDQKTAEIQASESRFRILVDQGVDSFFMHDMDGNFVNVNQQACKKLGYTKAELLKLTVADIDGDSVPRQDMLNIWQNLEPGDVFTLESHHKCRDGKIIPVEVRIGTLEIDGKTYMVSLARDITERLASQKEKHAMEVQLQQAQKMESIGTLAGGIAHDFNNILSAIMGYSQLAELNVEPGSDLAGYIQQISKAGNRAAELVKQILAFSRQQQQEKTPLQISIIVKEALKLLRASIPTTIKIERNIESNALILADATQIHQVIMNLCTNAYHAMADHGGILAVYLKEIDVDDTRKLDTIAEIPPGRYVVLSVSDTGAGMTEEIKNKVFEPYFTTKEQGRGTGLGLSVVLGIVKGHHGRIGVYSVPGEGTTFNVYLPVITAKIKEEAVPELPPPAHGERVMVVDDEQEIRRLTCKFLNDAGYKTESFTNGLEAWEAWQANPDKWDILLTDRTMPKMTGEELIARVRGLRPDAVVILCSGYNREISGDAPVMNGVVYLPKPIDRLSLLNCLAKCLS